MNNQGIQSAYRLVGFVFSLFLSPLLLKLFYATFISIPFSWSDGNIFVCIVLWIILMVWIQCIISSYFDDAAIESDNFL